MTIGPICWNYHPRERGAETQRLAHAARHEAPDFSMRMIGPAIGRVGPNHSSAGAVWLGD
jgi:hypothetical protein